MGARLAAVETELLEDPAVEVVGIERAAARSGAFGCWPDHLDPRLLAALRERDIERPWLHQAQALDAVAHERDVVLATSTASGKSLCFQVPIVEACLRDPSARALMLFPTKALTRDQVEGLRGLVEPISGARIGVGVYDGDTPPDQRRAIRASAHVMATNPDMLHRAVLPHHERWASLLAGLRVLVIDELHCYRGVFGSHIAHVVRRLLRLCAHYGAHPRIVACSATIANPCELAAALTGRDGFHLIDENTAPRGVRSVVVLNPSVVDQATGVRRDYLKVARRVGAKLRAAQISTLAFCRTRKAVELLTRYLREDEQSTESAGDRSPARSKQLVRGYRGGYLPDHRREVERALRGGEARVVVSTHALELGMDIGGLDAVMLAGYPGTVAATLQRAGRAGRRGAPALIVLVLSSLPLDQFVAVSPRFLFDRGAEHARIDPLNPEILVPHLRCAAYELPIRVGESMGGIAEDELGSALRYLGEHGVLHGERNEAGQWSYFAVGNEFPAEQVDLRGAIEENFSVIDDGRARGEVLAEVDFEDGPLYLHPGAIYPLEGRTYEVRALDWDARKAYVRAVNADYYTEAVTKLRLRMVEPLTRMSTAGTGYAHLVRTVPGFKKLRFGTHENIGFGPIELPDLELHTTAAYWSVPEAVLAELVDPVRRASAALAAAHALHYVAAMVLMCAPHDLGHAVACAPPREGVSGWSIVIAPSRGPTTEAVLQGMGTPALYLYDNLPGGAGLAIAAHALGPRFLDRAIDAVTGCGCETGCPTCLGAEHRGAPEAGFDRRHDVLVLLRALRAEVT